MTTFKSVHSLYLRQNRPGAMELAALERIKKIPINLYREESCEHSSVFIFSSPEPRLIGELIVQGLFWPKIFVREKNLILSKSARDFKI